MSYFSIVFLFPLLFVPSNYAIRTSRIIGGEIANAGQFPFIAAIYKNTNDGTYFCGGSLISDQWILTAGQCVENGILFSIRLGITNLNSNDESSLRLATDYYVLHPDYNPDTLENDVGLIKLRMPITYSDYVKPVDYLPVVDLQAQSGAVALGWGQNNDETAGLVDDLHWVALVVLSNAECKLVYGNQITDNMACGEGNYNQGTCQGDSGGPLVQDSGRGIRTQVGIASFISGNGCESTDPSGFTKIYPYTSWIYNITGM
ncbi:hypothetical protein Zmor_015476 [Zophobas morio]|uniref:Peptidase S1 domain-containing protein n=1 Tax=Zophobas morio TaxID=2755281 RepID=A0AA38MHR4_9CUCU|nr:hypothetical protein Zmor_015476 [Zophobas morio]